MQKFLLRRNMNIGTGMAENDGEFLKKCFLETPEYDTLLDFDDKKMILLGRTGSGKTALLKILLDNKDLVPIEIRPATFVMQYITNIPFIRIMKDSGLNLSIFYKFLWMHEIISNIIKQYFSYIKKKDFYTALSEILGIDGRMKELKNYLNQNDGIFYKEESIQTITSGLEKQIGTELGFTDIAYIADNLTESQKYEIQSKASQRLNTDQIKQLKNIITIFKEYFGKNKERKIIVCIDDLDTNWMDEQSKYDLLSALIDAIKQFIEIPNLKIIVAMRADLLTKTIASVRRQGEKDLAFTLKLNWTYPMLKELINKRLNYLFEYQYERKKQITINDLFECEISGKKGYDYILERTFMRPRDAIKFVNLCIVQADGNEYIIPNHILNAETIYRKEMLDALKDEWRNLYPNIDAYIKAIRNTMGNRFSFVEIKDKFENISDSLFSMNLSDEEDKVLQTFVDAKGNHTAEEEALKNLLNVLYTIGVLGVTSHTKDIVYSSSDKSELDMFDFDDNIFYLHPLFKKLEIK